MLTNEKITEIDYKLKNKKSLDQIVERSEEGSNESDAVRDNKSENSLEISQNKIEKIKRNKQRTR